MSWVVTVLVVYLGLLAALAVWSARETGTLSGFFIAGKKLPFWVIAFSTNATGESGWLLLGLTGMAYKVGAEAYWVLVGELLGIAGSWWIVSRRLKRLSDETDSITVPDVLAARFEDRWHLIRGISVIIILTMVTVYITAQLVASGKAMSGFLGTDYSTGVIVGSVIVIGYTFIGGYKAVCYTDVLQGVMMLLGLIAVPIAAIHAAGGVGAVVDTLEAEDPNLLNLLSPSGNGIADWVRAISFVAIGLPFLGVPQLLVRFMSARDDLEVRKARIMSVLVLIFFSGGAVTAGIAGRALVPELADAEKIFPTLSTELFPPVLAGVMLVVVLSAIMSTADSLLLLASSAVVRDTIQKIFGSRRSDHALAGYGKIVTILIGVVAVAFAIPEAKFIFSFVLYAWSGLGAAFGPVVLCLLYSRRTSYAGVVAGMLAGFIVSIVWVAVFKDRAYGLYEAVPGFAAGIAVTLIVSAFTGRSAAQVENG